MTISLPSNPDINLLKKQAKKLLTQYRVNNADALASVESLHPKPEFFKNLRDAQLVIARNYGFVDWTALSDAVAIANYGAKSLTEKAELFIQLGCVQYNGNDARSNYHHANELLKRYPEIADHSFYTALVANNKQAVLIYLQSNPQLASSEGGPLNWPALLYLAYARIQESADSKQSVEIIQLLLDNGADVNAHIILNDSYRFTALTGVIGEGEAGINQPPHQFADELAQLLLDAGANPNDSQALYNTMFTDSIDKWLPLFISKGLNEKHMLNWDDANNAEQTTFDYQLSSSIDSGHAARVKILLEAGANPNTVNSYNGRTIHTNALLRGHEAIAALLLNAGAMPQKLTLKEEFMLVCVREDDNAIVDMLEQDPSLKEENVLLHNAANHCDFKIVKRLIELGFNVNAQEESGRTLLHHFALNNAVDEIKTLLLLGADITLRDYSHKNTPVGFAAYSGSNEVMYLLLDQSTDFLQVICCAYLERAKILIEQNPEHALQRTPQGHTPLHLIGICLQESPDYTICKTLLELLLAAGVSIDEKNDQGQTPVEFFLERGAETMADLLNGYSR